MSEKILLIWVSLLSLITLLLVMLFSKYLVRSKHKKLRDSLNKGGQGRMFNLNEQHKGGGDEDLNRSEYLLIVSTAGLCFKILSSSIKRNGIEYTLGVINSIGGLIKDGFESDTEVIDAFLNEVREFLENNEPIIKIIREKLP